MRDGLKIKQSEWNIVKMGNSAHAGKCIKARYKNIRMETMDGSSSSTISVMSNGVIDVSCPKLSHMIKLIIFKSAMDTLVDYTNPVLDSYRSSTHDAILIYGFIPERASGGAFKTSFILQDGFKYVINS